MNLRWSRSPVAWSLSTGGCLLARRGTATLIGYGGKNYVVTTRHQFDLLLGSDVSKEVLETARVAKRQGNPVQRRMGEGNYI